jgi:hypothetical protein
MTETGYNGWKNYETWAIALWLDNDYGTYTLMKGLAMQSMEEVLAEKESNYQLQEHRQNLINKASYRMSNEIKKYVEEGNPLAVTASVYADLLGAAIDEADFGEIAEHYLEEDLVDSAIEDWESNSDDTEE